MEKKNITFDDLEFKPWGTQLDRKRKFRNSALLKYYHNAKQAVVTFDNGYTVSVLSGNMFYSDGVETYEVGVMVDGKMATELEFLDDGILGYCTKALVTEILKTVQGL